MKRSLATISLVLGLFLMALSLIGDFTGFGGYENEDKRDWEKFDPSLVRKIRSIDDLIDEAMERAGGPAAFISSSADQKMTFLHEVVIDRFTHSEGARHTIFTNWVLFFAGEIAGPLGVIWDPELFVSKGHSLVCSQSSYLLLQLALRSGITARHVGLNGHVVMEAWYDDDWHLYDPDAEVMPRDGSGRVISVEALSKHRAMLERYYPRVKGDFVDIFASREDNSFVSYPAGAYFEWKSQVLFYVEKAAQILKYLVPAVLVLFSVYLRFAHDHGRKRHGDH